jgi:hypothetical protein
MGNRVTYKKLQWSFYEDKDDNIFTYDSCYSCV